MKLSDLYNQLLKEQRESREELEEETFDNGVSWLSGYCQGVDTCVEIVRRFLIKFGDMEDGQ